MIFLVVIYDVESESKNGVKLLKILRKYLTHIQKSCFEGYITHKNLTSLKNEIESINDSKIKLKMYVISSKKYVRNYQIGEHKVIKNLIIGKEK